MRTAIHTEWKRVLNIRGRLNDIFMHIADSIPVEGREKSTGSGGDSPGFGNRIQLDI